MKYKNCMNCGHANPMENRFCAKCGAAFRDTVPQQNRSKEGSKKRMLVLGVGAAVLALLCLLFLLSKMFQQKPAATPGKGICTVVYTTSDGVTLGTTTVNYVHGATDTIVPPSFSGYITPDTQIVTWDTTSTKLITFIYAPATVPYDIVYSSSNGTILGTATADYLHGTTNTITPPDFEGYSTPAAQTVAWDSTHTKTIHFTYTPIPVFNETKSGSISADPTRGLSYCADVEYQNRTATSIQLRVVWTTTLSGVKIYNNFSQRFVATVGSVDTGPVILVDTGPVVITDYGHWKDASSTPRSATVYSDWITVPLGTTNAATTDMSIYYYQVNKYGKDVTQSGKAVGLNTVWTINIPAY